MKNTFLRLFLLLLGLTPIILLEAQKPEFPKPDRQENIPFGRKLPAPTSLQSRVEIVLDTINQLVFFQDHDAFGKKMMHSEKPMHHLPDLNMHDHHEVLVPPCRFHLTKDINTSTPGSNPHNYGFVFQPSFAVMDHVAYFNADDGIHGYELWRSDGTANGTYMVKDILEGSGSGSASSIIAADGKLFFSAYTDSSGWAPWVSDGTKHGTHMIMKIPAEIYHTYAEQFVRVGKKIFFTTNSDHGNALWVTDGTSSGTHLLYNFNLYFEWAGYINQATAAGNLLFFTAWTPVAGRELWRSDGTPEGTFLVKDIGPDQGDYYAPMQLTAFNHKLYFSGNDGSGRKLWSSDGLYTGTSPVLNPDNVMTQNENVNYWDNVNFAVLDHNLYFAGFTYAAGSGLYKVSATPGSGIQLVKDLWPGWEYFIISAPELKKVGQKLFFKVISSIGGYHDELWTSDGNGYATNPVKQFMPGQVTTVYKDVRGKLFFVEDEAATGPELWTSDGTLAGTHLVRDIYKGTTGSYPYFMTSLDGKLLMSATDAMGAAELWVSDGTAATTHRVKDINEATTYGSKPADEMRSICQLDDESVVFAAFEPMKGRELYTSDGTEDGSFLVKDILTGEPSSYPNVFIKRKSGVYFRANNENTSMGFPGSTIWKTDGTKGGTQSVVAVNGAYFLGYNVNQHGLVFYTIYNLSTYAYELWRSDGTPGGNFMLNSQLNYNPNVVVVKDKAYFVAGDFLNGFELWTSDGSMAGTRMVKDINPGYGGSYPYSLYAWKGRLYFAAYDGVFYNYSFWTSDGTAAGTKKLKDINPAYFDYSQTDFHFCGTEDYLFLNAFDPNANPYQGGQLWRTDGTASGTKLVKHINTFNDANPMNLTAVDNELYFTADDGVHGVELWKSDGSWSGTKMMKEIEPGPGKIFLSNFCSIGSTLYFLKDAGSDNSTLWFSKEHDETEMVKDHCLEELKNMQYLLAAGDKLYFSAFSPAVGDELFVGEPGHGEHAFHPVLMDAQAVTGVAEEPVVFNAVLSPNPTRGSSQLQLQGCLPETEIAVTDAKGAIVWKYKYAGSSTIIIPSENWSSGWYLVTIRSGLDKKVMKLVKQ